MNYKLKESYKNHIFLQKICGTLMSIFSYKYSNYSKMHKRMEKISKIYDKEIADNSYSDIIKVFFLDKYDKSIHSKIIADKTKTIIIGERNTITNIKDSHVYGVIIKTTMLRKFNTIDYEHSLYRSIAKLINPDSQIKIFMNQKQVNESKNIDISFNFLSNYKSMNTSNIIIYESLYALLTSITMKEYNNYNNSNILIKDQMKVIKNKIRRSREK